MIGIALRGGGVALCTGGEGFLLKVLFSTDPVRIDGKVRWEWVWIYDRSPLTFSRVNDVQTILGGRRCTSALSLSNGFRWRKTYICEYITTFVCR